MFKKLGLLTVTVLSVTALGFGGTTAQAKTKAAHVVKTTTYKSRHKVHVQGGWMYSTPKLTRQNHHLTKYLYTKFYATKKVTVRQRNGKTTTLNYLKSKDGQTKGYVKTANVRNKWGYGKYSVAAYRKGALTALNQERDKQGLHALKETAKMDQVAQKNTERLVKQGKENFTPILTGIPHAGWVRDQYIAPKKYPVIGYENGNQWGRETIYELMGYTNITSGAAEIAKPYLLSKGHTRVGFGGIQRGQAIYMFILFSHD